MHLEYWQWLLAALAALIIGFSKTGVGGLSLLAVALFGQIFPDHTKQVSGLILPLLIVGDLVAVGSYRRHIQWKFLWKLFPWTALGVLSGWFAMGRIDDRQARLLVGVIILAMVAMHLWRRHTAKKATASPSITAARDPATQHGAWFAPTMGILAGFTTLIANAAGPLMAIYLLAMRLPKMEFVGTGAVFFMILNWFKVPFMVNLGLITIDSAQFNLLLAPAVILGAFVGRAVLPRVNQRLFENLALTLSAVSGAKMLFW
ncbi:MAG: sulfite exporter TauE/SafE family protein [Nibricoccus sp.]